MSTEQQGLTFLLKETTGSLTEFQPKANKRSSDYKSDFLIYTQRHPYDVVGLNNTTTH